LERTIPWNLFLGKVHSLEPLPWKEPFLGAYSLDQLVAP
jgi:hypothetical protein